MAVSLLCASPASAALIDWEAEPTGVKANGFSPVGHPLVHFTDSVGGNLDVQNYEEQCNSGPGQKCLAVNTDFDASRLFIDFDTPMSQLSLLFGNDEPFGSNPVQHAVLEIYNGVTLIAPQTVLVNNNNVGDQTIGYTGSPSTRPSSGTGARTGCRQR